MLPFGLEIWQAAATGALVLAGGLVELGAFEPAETGFVWGDQSLRFPEPDETVSDGLLLALSFAAPLALLPLAVHLRGGAAGVGLPPARAAVAFVYGWALTLTLTDTIKLATGRLRPYFVAVCAPDVSGFGDALADTTYVPPGLCTGDADDIASARKSFPSGHASLALYACVFCLGAAWRLLRHQGRTAARVAFVDVPVLGLYLWIALSRVSDGAHHGWDVAAGSALGAACGAVALVVGGLLPGGRGAKQKADKEMVAVEEA